jgi:hypothetical protein
MAVWVICVPKAGVGEEFWAKDPKMHPDPKISKKANLPMILRRGARLA